MKTPHLLLVALTSAFAGLLLTPAVFAQGALTPPGAPAPTMKTLDQIEARKPLGSPNTVTTSTIVIDQPGSYVLVGPITVASGDGITITADNVTLDLNGFTIASTASPRAGSGVNATGKSIVVRNGAIQGEGADNNYFLDPNSLGFADGVLLGSVSGSLASAGRNTRVQEVWVGGFPGFGIVAEQVDRSSARLGSLTTISGRLVTDSSIAYYYGVGIEARNVSRSTVGFGFGTAAIRAQVIDTCTAGISGGPGMIAKIIKHSYVEVGGVSGTPFNATIAIGCVFTYDTQGSNVGGPPVNVITNRYDMPASP
jgi:hypothetical protein